MKQATIELIENIRVHPNADKLELANVLGYQVIIPKGEFIEGQKILYIQPDSVLPEDSWAESYRKFAPKRVKAIKLRKEWSEGLVVSFKDIAKEINSIPLFLDIGDVNYFVPIPLEVGIDISQFLNIKHYEPPQPNDLQAKGGLPFGIPKTDEERWENIKNKLPIDEYVDVTLKVDGQSWSMFYNNESKEFGILGRTMEYKEECDNNYTKHLQRIEGLKERFIEFCESHNKSLCIRGESYGNGIQGLKCNPHGNKDLGLAIFSVFNIKERRYINKGELYYFYNVAPMLELGTVPMLEYDVPLTWELIKKYSEDLEQINGENFEGVVIKHANGSFKIINKHYDSLK